MGETYANITPDVEYIPTWRDKIKVILCWIISHEYIPIDLIHITNRRYYFRRCKRCFHKDEGWY